MLPAGSGKDQFSGWEGTYKGQGPSIFCFPLLFYLCELEKIHKMTTGYPNKDCRTQLKTWLGEFPLWLLPSLLILRPSPSSRMLELQEGPNWEFPESSSRFAAWLTASLHPQGNAVGKHFPPEGCRSSLL